MSPRRLSALLAPVWLLCAAAAAADPIAISLSPVYLNPESREQRVVGRLEALAAFSLSAPDSRFGGWSGMVLSADGVRLVAVSDVGFWLTARLVHDAEGRLVGLAEAEIAPMQGLDGAPLRSKREADAESLARDRDGSLIVGFEGQHRLWRYRPGDDPLHARPEPVETPPLLQRAPRNGGLEAMTVLADGRLLMVTEELQLAAGELAGWLRQDGAWAVLAYLKTGEYKPTELAQLPSGDVLALERRFTALGGPGMRLQRLPLGQIRAGARLSGQALAELIPPLSVDNMEAMAAVRAADGSTHVYVMSDDNFNPLQRTLLFQFRLLE